MKSDICTLVTELQQSRFYGSVELKYEDGRLMLIRKSETLKPMEKPAGHDDPSNH